MRTILFRGQTPAGDWLYGSLMMSYNGDTYIWQMDTPEHLAQGMKFVTPDSVGQMTNQEDKNGAPIFEGDIVEDAWHAESKRLYVIVYDEICDGLVANLIGDDNEIELCCLDPDSLTIVGNTTDNPELLQQ